MPEEMRQAMRSALADGKPSTGSTTRPELDVYRREADALLVPGIARAEAVRRISQRMGLEMVEEDTSSAHLLFRIVQSTKYNYLTLHFDHDKFASYSLRSINGPTGV